MSALTVFATILFAITYILMFALQKYRPYIAVLSGIIFVVVGMSGGVDSLNVAAASAVAFWELRKR